MHIGVDLIVGAGLVYHGVSREVDGKVHVSIGAWAELGGMFAIALVGMGFQFWKHQGEFAQTEAVKTNYRASDNPILL